MPLSIMANRALLSLACPTTLPDTRSPVPVGCQSRRHSAAKGHFWVRELAKLGHEVRLMPPSYVKPYVKRGKTGAADAAAKV